MTSLWPWLAVAGVGALHGLSPANGWMFAAAWGVHARDAAQARRALWPIALGHGASVGVVASVLTQALLIAAAVLRLLRGARPCTPIGAPTGHAGIALWSFLMATAHGAGLMLVPALVPLCLADSPAREITASGSLLLATAAVGVHMAAMLLTAGAIATGVCRSIARHPRLLDGSALQPAWTALLAVNGALLMALR
jgi:hypothetical protein